MPVPPATLTTTTATSSTSSAYVTLVTSEPYVLGALVLAQSLHASGTNHDLVVLFDPQLSTSSVDRLRDEYNLVVPITPLRSSDHVNLQRLGRPDLDITYSKLHVWTLTQFDKIVFLDADTLVLSNIDDLFERDELSAAPDCGWPDIFNSGVFVLKPSMDTFERLLSFAAARGSWDGGDQGLLNDYFSDWNTTPGRRLPFIYNVTPTSVYTYAPAFERFQADIKVIHFAGPNKPWTYAQSDNGQPIGKSSTPAGSVLFTLVTKWWSVFNTGSASWGYLLKGHGSKSNSTHTKSHQGSYQYGESGYQHNNTWSGGNAYGGPNDMSVSRYAWPEHELDEFELDNWRKAMSTSTGGRSFRLHKHSPVNQLKSPTSPTMLGIYNNFANELPDSATTTTTTTTAINHLNVPTLISPIAMSPSSPYSHHGSGYFPREISCSPEHTKLPRGASPMSFGDHKDYNTITKTTTTTTTINDKNKNKNKNDKNSLITEMVDAMTITSTSTATSTTTKTATKIQPMAYDESILLSGGSGNISSSSPYGVGTAAEDQESPTCHDSFTEPSSSLPGVISDQFSSALFSTPPITTSSSILNHSKKTLNTSTITTNTITQQHHKPIVVPRSLSPSTRLASPRKVTPIDEPIKKLDIDSIRDDNDLTPLLSRSTTTATNVPSSTTNTSTNKTIKSVVALLAVAMGVAFVSYTSF